jgi:hypothetical protein
MAGSSAAAAAAAAAAVLQVTQHPACNISVTTVVPRGSSEDEFILNGLAVVARRVAVRTQLDKLSSMYQARLM